MEIVVCCKLNGSLYINDLAVVVVFMMLTAEFKF